MQFAGILPQTTQGTGETAGLQATAGTSDGDTSGSGFLSLLQGVQNEQAAESGPVEPAAFGGSASPYTADQSLALALNLAGVLLAERPMVQPNEAEQDTAHDTVPEEGTVQGLLLTAVQGIALSGLGSEGLVSQEPQSAEGSSIASAVSSIGPSVLPAQAETGLVVQGEPAPSEGAEPSFAAPTGKSVEGIPVEGPQQEEAVDPSAARAGHGGPQFESNRPETQDAQSTHASRVAQSRPGGDAAPVERHAAAEPVFRLPGTKAEETPGVTGAGGTDAAVAGEGTERQGQAALGEREAGPEFHAAESEQEASSFFRQDLASSNQQESGTTPSPSPFAMRGHEFAVPAAASAQAAPPAASAAPAPPPAPVQTVSLEPQTPNSPSSQSVQFDLPNTDFGQLRVRVVLSDQTVHTHMVTDRADLGRLLVDRQDHLGAQLSTAGLDLGQLRVQIDRHGSHQQGYEPFYRQDERFHQPSGQRQPERPSHMEMPRRENAGALSLFA